MCSHKKLASGVEMVLLMRFLAIVISTVGFLNSPGQSIRFPLTVSLIFGLQISVV